MCTYYDLEQSPGNTSNHLPATKYDFLDHDEVENELLDFCSDKIKKVTLKIPSIHCSSCIWLLENLKELDDSIISSKVNFSKKMISIDFAPQKTKLKNVITLLHQLGYQPEINLSTNKLNEVEGNSDLYLKIGVAGFCFGNIMLLSFPEYLGFEVEIEFQHYFGYLNLLLALPVLLFSATDYIKSAYQGLIHQYSNIDIPIALGVIALFIRSAIEVLTNTGPGYFDSLSGLIFFLIIGKWVQNKTYEGLSFERDYRSYFPLAVLRLNGKNKEPVLVEKLRVNDEIYIRPGEIIPADSVLLSQDTHIDYSFVTGESAPVDQGQYHKVYAGGKVVGIPSTFKVIKDVSQNYLTQLWNQAQIDNSQQDRGAKLINLVSKYFTLIILTIALSAAIFWYFQDPTKVFFVFTAVLIIACPCALTLATPFTLNAIMNILGRSKLYLKNSAVIERLWRINHIIFDKTGTITQSEEGMTTFIGADLTEHELNMIHSITSSSTHPYSLIIARNIDANSRERIIHNFKETTGFGISGSIGSNRIKVGALNYVMDDAACPDKNEFNIRSPRVHVSINDLYKGYFQIINKYRKGIRGMIDTLKEQYALSILSGDNSSERDQLQNLFPSNANLLFNQKPDEKLSYVQHISRSGNHVMMIGDGLNDSGALKSSTVGIAITEDMATFTPASDAILIGKHLNYLGEFLSFVKKSKWILIVAFIISFLYNIIGLSFAVTGHLTPIFAAILMPLSSVTVVTFATMATRLLSQFYKLPE